MRTGWLKGLFITAGLYDGVLALAFFFFWESIFRGFGVTPPNHPGYVQFPALLLLVFAAMFLQVARDPVKNRGLIPYGMGLKAAYSGSVFWHQLTSGVPAMWVGWAWVDLVFLVLFVAAFKITAGTARTAADE